MRDSDAEIIIKQLTDLSHAAWRQVQEQEETNRLLRVICAANGAAEAARAPKPEGE